MNTHHFQLQQFLVVELVQELWRKQRRQADCPAESTTTDNERTSDTQHKLWHNLSISTSVFGDGRISTHADPTSTQCANLIDTQLQYVFPSWTLLHGGWPIRLILGFWNTKVPQNGSFPAQDAHEPLCKIWRR